MSLTLTKPRAPWIQDQFNVDFAGVPVGCVGLVGGRWFCVAEDAKFELSMHFATAEEAAQYMVNVVCLGQPQQRLRRVV